jgi:VanZ family protein
MKSYLKYNWPSILWAAFILVLCMMPGRHIPHVRIPNFDKVVHFSLYLIFAILTYWGWQKQNYLIALHAQTTIKVIVLLSLYGYTIELMQGWLTTDRSYDIYDALANVCGAIVGALIASQIVGRNKI